MGLGGIGYFGQNREQDKKTLNWYAYLISQGFLPFAYSDNDSHGWVKLIAGDEERWSHITWIMSTRLTADKILDAIEDGQTYASRGWAKLTKLDFPCNAQLTDDSPDKPRFDFDLEFIRYNNGVPEQFDAPEEIRFVIYRDGKVVPESTQTFPKGTTKCQYSWSDTGVKGAERHVYFLWVDNYIVTSPIVFGPSYHLK
jgi:hypothetical protein